MMEQQCSLDALRKNPHQFLKQYFNRFASSKSKKIYGELRMSFYEFFELRFFKCSCSYSEDGEEVLDGHDLVINNKEARIDNYRDFMDNMEDLLGDCFDKP